MSQAGRTGRSGQTARILLLRSQGWSKAKIADHLGLSLRYVQNVTRGTPDQRQSFVRKDNPPDEIIYLRSRISQLERELRERSEDSGGLQEFFKQVMDNIQAIVPEPLEYKPPKIKPGSVRINSPVVAVAHWTDWHVGAVQTPGEIEGFGEFSPELAKSRMLSYVRAFSKWVEAHRSVYVVDELNVLATGDLISGAIHDELLVTAAFPVPVQVVEAAKLFADSVAFLAPRYHRVVVHFVVEDNHGRLTRKPQASQAGLNSFNYLVGLMAKEFLAQHSNVEFWIYPQFQVTVPVGGRYYLLSHGHKVQGWAGFPYYGLERRAHREAMKRMQTGIGKFDRVIIGHWHAPLCHPYYWIGGSLSGTSAYDHANGRHAPPSQAAWMVHPRHGEFDRTDFDLYVPLATPAAKPTPRLNTREQRQTIDEILRG